MDMNNVKPLHPLSHGNVLIVGVKSSNLTDEIREHPRVVIWDSQQQHWTNKEMPQNTQAVFMTRFVSHNTSTMLLKQARKRRITIFNPEGTGLIVKQVKELLNMNDEPATEPITENTPKEEETIMTPKKKLGQFNKLKALIPFIDFSKTNSQNAAILLEKCKEIGITSTFNSLANYVGTQRRGARAPQGKIKTPKKVEVSGMDVSVEILDGIIKELQDMRAFLIATTEENQRLKAKVNKFKQFFDE